MMYRLSIATNSRHELDFTIADTVTDVFPDIERTLFHYRVDEAQLGLLTLMRDDLRYSLI